MTRAKQLLTICEMGRPKKKMEDFVDSIVDTVQEHLWKVFAYHKQNPQDIRQWLISLNKYFAKLRTYNVPKTGRGKNLDRSELQDVFTDTMFGNPQDIQVLIHNWHEKGYPIVFVSEASRQKLLLLSNKWVDRILQDAGIFSVLEYELSQQ